MNLTNIIIESDRLILKPIDVSFAEDIFREFTEEISVYMDPQPAKDINGVMDFINYSRKGLENGDNLQLVVIEKTSDVFLGCAGLHDIGTKDPELGIWIKKSAHGNKYGLETVSAIIDWAGKNIEFNYLRYPVDKRNYASRNIPEKNGGIIKREFKANNQNGVELDQVEYWIYK